jgi:hypothetical protein
MKDARKIISNPRCFGGRDTLVAPGRLLVLAGVVLLYLSVFLSRDLADLSGDSARYLLLARGLAQGQGYVDLEKPGQPAHTEFAPGLPVLLAPFFRLSSSLVPGKIIMAVFLIGAIIAGAWLARTVMADAPAWLVAAVTLGLATMPYYARFANQILSDLPYTAVSLLALGLIYSQLGKDRPPSRTWLTIGLVMSVAYFFRQTALTLWLGTVMGLSCHRPYRPAMRARAAALVTVGFFLPVSAWLVRNYLAAGALDSAHWNKLFMAVESDPFAGSLGPAGLALRIVAGLADYLELTGVVFLDLLWIKAPKAVNFIVAGLFLLPALYGLAVRARSKRGPLEWYLIFYLILISAWQSHYARYLVPVIPLAWVLAGEGLRLWTEPNPHQPSSWKQKLTASLTILALGLNALVFLKDAYLVRHEFVTPAPALAVTEEDGLLLELTGPIHWGYWHQYPEILAAADPVARARAYHRQLAAGAWMRDHLPANAVVMARKPTLAAYSSGHYAIQFVPERNAEEFFARCRERGVTHFLLDENSPVARELMRGHLAYLRGRPEWGTVRPVFALGDTAVLAYGLAGR